MKIEQLSIRADGASRGNPGPAAIGATIKDGQGNLVARISRRIGTATNNQAEYMALIAALNEAIRLGARKVDINLDSQLVVRQINGQYRVKNNVLKSLLHEVRQLAGCLEQFNIAHVPRQQNAEADRLANMALR